MKIIFSHEPMILLQGYQSKYKFSEHLKMYLDGLLISKIFSWCKKNILALTYAGWI